MKFKSLHPWPKRSTTSTSLSAYRGPAFASRPTHFKSLSLFLSSCTITSTLGSKQPPTDLHFTHFLAEDPLIGIFSCTQDPHIPLPRRRKIAHRRHSDENAICRLLAQLFPWCKASIVVQTREGRWEYEVPRRAMKWCSREHGVLLVDWQAVYVECFEEEQRRVQKDEQRRVQKEGWRMARDVVEEREEVEKITVME